MGDSTGVPHDLLCALYLTKKEVDKAIAEGERAVALNPGDPQSLLDYATCLYFTGRPEEAIPLLEKAIRLSPLGISGLYVSYGAALGLTGRFEESVSALKKALLRAPDNINAHLSLAATYIRMGREKEARVEAAEVLRINPKFLLDNYAKVIPVKDQSQIDRYIDMLRKAGLK
jgi:adenylate cyclase